METIHKIGRRKKSIARIYLSEGEGNITINGKELTSYFSTSPLIYKVNQPFLLTGTEGRFDVKVNVTGGGITGQAEAIRLAISRALCEIENDAVAEVDEEGEEEQALTFRAILKPEGLLTRDPRMVERKKFGQKKARKKFQFSKR